MHMKIFMEPEGSKSKEKKVMYSTSLPKGIRDSLQEAATLLQRKKADWVRASLNLFLGLKEKEQEQLILNNYPKMDLSHLRPFTTTLLESQLVNLSNLSKSFKRSKAEIVRTAIFVFLAKNAVEQEKEIKKSLSR